MQNITAWAWFLAHSFITACCTAKPATQAEGHRISHAQHERRTKCGAVFQQHAAGITVLWLWLVLPNVPENCILMHKACAPWYCGLWWSGRAWILWSKLREAVMLRTCQLFLPLHPSDGGSRLAADGRAGELRLVPLVDHILAALHDWAAWRDWHTAGMVRQTPRFHQQFIYLELNNSTKLGGI